MVIIMVILTIGVFVAVDLYRTRNRVVALPIPGEKPLTVRISEAMDRFSHPGHSWMIPEEAGTVMVGVDDFAQRFIGPIDSVELPAVGARLTQGEPMTTLRRGKRSLTIVTPVSGELSEVNQTLSSSPQLVNEVPYAGGWIAKIIPDKLTVEIRNLLKGKSAEKWRETLKFQLVQTFSPKLGVMMHDGGRLVDDIGDLIPDGKWEESVAEFFPDGKKPERPGTDGSAGN